MLYAAYPLYRLGGDRAVLLLPMLGAVLTALAARALARRLGGGSGWTAFWAIGLATSGRDLRPRLLGALARARAHAVGRRLAARRRSTGEAGGAELVGSGAAVRCGRDHAHRGARATSRSRVPSLCITRSCGVDARSAVRSDAASRSVAGAAAVLVGERHARARDRSGRPAGEPRARVPPPLPAACLGDRVPEAFTTTIGLNGFQPRLDWLARRADRRARRRRRRGGSARTAVTRASLGGRCARRAPSCFYLVRFAVGLGYRPGAAHRVRRSRRSAASLGWRRAAPAADGARVRRRSRWCGSPSTRAVRDRSGVAATSSCPACCSRSWRRRRARGRRACARAPCSALLVARDRLRRRVAARAVARVADGMETHRRPARPGASSRPRRTSSARAAPSTSPARHWLTRDDRPGAAAGGADRPRRRRHRVRLWSRRRGAGVPVDSAASCEAGLSASPSSDPVTAEGHHVPPGRQRPSDSASPRARFAPMKQG